MMQIFNEAIFRFFPNTTENNYVVKWCQKEINCRKHENEKYEGSIDTRCCSPLSANQRFGSGSSHRGKLVQHMLWKKVLTPFWVAQCCPKLNSLFNWPSLLQELRGTCLPLLPQQDITVCPGWIATRVYPMNGQSREFRKCPLTCAWHSEMLHECRDASAAILENQIHTVFDALEYCFQHYQSLPLL